jgi:hypothetical protein
MHQPLFFAHKEGMSHSNSEIVHRLAALHQLDTAHRINLAVALGYINKSLKVNRCGDGYRNSE